MFFDAKNENTENEKIINTHSVVSIHSYVKIIPVEILRNLLEAPPSYLNIKIEQLF